MYFSTPISHIFGSYYGVVNNGNSALIKFIFKNCQLGGGGGGAYAPSWIRHCTNMNNIIKYGIYALDSHIMVQA